MSEMATKVFVKIALMAEDGMAGRADDSVARGPIALMVIVYLISLVETILMRLGEFRNSVGNILLSLLHVSDIPMILVLIFM